MTPPPNAGTARAARSEPRSQSRAEHRAPLKVVAKPRRRQRSLLSRAEAVSVAAIFAALLAIVGGYTMLTQGEVQLTTLQSQLTAEQSIHHGEVLAVAGLEAPARIIADAGRQHLVQPASIDQLPAVSLAIPLPPLQVLPPVVSATPVTVVTVAPVAPMSRTQAGVAPAGHR